jgi:hypothetical protein
MCSCGRRLRIVLCDRRRQYHLVCDNQERRCRGVWTGTRGGSGRGQRDDEAGGGEMKHALACTLIFSTVPRTPTIYTLLWLYLIAKSIRRILKVVTLPALTCTHSVYTVEAAWRQVSITWRSCLQCLPCDGDGAIPSTRIDQVKAWYEISHRPLCLRVQRDGTNACG